MLRRVIAVVAVAVGLSTAAMGDERGLAFVDRVALVIGNSAYLHTSDAVATAIGPRRLGVSRAAPMS